MSHQSLNQGQQTSDINSQETYPGQRWLVEERDACGVGFITHRQNIASHEILEKALTALTCLEHRGGCSADQDSGDGAGILTAIPWELLAWENADKIDFSNLGNMAVGMIFFPQDPIAAESAKRAFAQIAAEIGRAHV
jgi:glutamate synthase (ferredoxin)